MGQMDWLVGWVGGSFGLVVWLASYVVVMGIFGKVAGSGCTFRLLP